jgi:hypothetical protein
MLDATILSTESSSVSKFRVGRTTPERSFQRDKVVLPTVDSATVACQCSLVIGERSTGTLAYLDSDAKLKESKASLVQRELIVEVSLIIHRFY